MAKPIPCDAEKVAVEVDQSAAGIARIDGGVGLNRVFKSADAEVAPEGADDAERDGLSHAVGIADGEYDVTDPRLIGCREGDCRDVLEIDFQDRHVGLRIGADNTGLAAPAIRQCYFDFIGGFDHVVVGQHIALFADNHAGAQARRAPRLCVELAAEEITENRVVHERVPRHLDFLAGEYVHYRRRCFAYRIAEREHPLLRRRRCAFASS